MGIEKSFKRCFPKVKNLVKKKKGRKEVIPYTPCLSYRKSTTELDQLRGEVDQQFGRNNNPLSDILRLNREGFTSETPKVGKIKP